MLDTPVTDNARPNLRGGVVEGTEWQTEAQGTIPFPAYQDPMVHRAHDVAATEQDVSKPPARPRAGRSNTAKMLADIVDNTDALRLNNERRVDSAHASGSAVQIVCAQEEVPNSPCSNASTLCSGDEGGEDEREITGSEPAMMDGEMLQMEAVDELLR